MGLTSHRVALRRVVWLLPLINCYLLLNCHGWLQLQMGTLATDALKQINGTQYLVGSAANMLCKSDAFRSIFGVQLSRFITNNTNNNVL